MVQKINQRIQNLIRLILIDIYLSTPIFNLFVTYSITS
jgi:hypothetical protein